MRRLRSTSLWGIVLVTVLPVLVGCGRLDRGSTLNQVTLTPGARAETVLEQQLAREGFRAAKVSCTKNLIVNVGTTSACKVSGAGGKDLVRFTFSDSHGAITLSSVKAS